MDMLQRYCSFPGILDEYFSIINCAIIITNIEGQILYANPVIKKILGHKPDELLFMELSEIFTPEDLTIFYPNLLYMAGKNMPFSDEVMLKRKDGSRFFAYLTMMPSNNPEKKQPDVMVSIQDINDYKIMEKLVNENVSEVLSGAVSGFINEVTSPIDELENTVKSAEEASLNNNGSPRHYAQVNEKMHRVAELVRQFESIVTLPKPVYKMENIRSLVKEAAQPYLNILNEKGVNFNILPAENTVDDFSENQINDSAGREDDSERLLVDRDQLIKALSIILDFQMNIVPEGENISFSIENKNNRVSIYLNGTSSEYRLESPDRIFEPFFNPAPDDVVSELPVVKRILESHQGFVDFSPNDSNGYTFTLTFPWQRRRYIRVYPLNYTD